MIFAIIFAAPSTIVFLAASILPLIAELRGVKSNL
jgi:hypothetical protein